MGHPYLLYVPAGLTWNYYSGSLNGMNRNPAVVRLRDFMDREDGWGRTQGREVFQRLQAYVEGHPEVQVFRVSLEGVRRIDISFASETVVELARSFRQRKGFCFTDLSDSDMLENWEAAAERKEQPLMVWNGGEGRVIGVKPSSGTVDAFMFALNRPVTRAAEYIAAKPSVSIANASTKFKQLWEHGFLLRREDSADSGGREFTYRRIA